MDGTRTILHVDMNAFFAAVEQRDDPRLARRPVAVVGPGSRTVVVTASYEARARGVKTGMPAPWAKALCPELALVVARHGRYVAEADALRAIFLQFTPQVETFSIDEAFLDISGCLRYSDGASLGRALKERIRQERGLLCSVGVAPNKLLAKLASDRQKPDGLTVFTADDLGQVLRETPAGDICGIGPKTAAALERLGVSRVAEIARVPAAVLRQVFGEAQARFLLRAAEGLDPSPVVPDEQAKPAAALGHAMTLEQDLTSREQMQPVLHHLCELVARRARQNRLAGRTVTLTVRTCDFATVSRQNTSREPTCRSAPMLERALALLSAISPQQPVRLLGVQLSNLCAGAEQLPLFAEARREALATLAMDAVNDRFGERTLVPANLLGRKGRNVIAPSWRPDGSKRTGEWPDPADNS